MKINKSIFKIILILFLFSTISLFGFQNFKKDYQSFFQTIRNIKENFINKKMDCNKFLQNLNNYSVNNNLNYHIQLNKEYKIYFKQKESIYPREFVKIEFDKAFKNKFDHHRKYNVKYNDFFLCKSNNNLYYLRIWNYNIASYLENIMWNN